ncbi:MAG: S49 family peptidase [Deltaproteobacteria bacterium]|nr:S49 family peptidase [Deltaproteobacteria bacterium]
MPQVERFQPEGEPLALAPEAFGTAFAVGQGGLQESAGCAVLSIRGPLMNREHHFFDSYEAIRGRMAAAIKDGATRIVLDVDSPGGLAAGCFDCARDLRRMANDAGVELVAHVGAQATSAAYALASAATKIGCSSSAILGSIGVISGLVDATKMLDRFGLNVKLVYSGARKPDGHMANPIEDDAVSAAQARIDALAEEFFALVVEHGWGKSVSAVRSLEAGVVLGKEAVRIGLASEIASLEDMTSQRARGAQKGSAMKRSANLIALAASMGLSPEFTDDELVTAVRSNFVPKADKEAADERASKAEADLAKVRDSAFAEKADRAVGQAVRDGKVAPSSKAFYRSGITDDASLKSFEDEMARRTPTITAGSDPEDKPLDADAVFLTADEKLAAKQMGISEEEMLKQKKLELAKRAEEG